MAKTINREAQIHTWVDGKEIIITESSVRRDLQLEDEEGVDCLPNSTIFENLKLMGLVRVSTIASSLEVEQDSGTIDKTQSKAAPNEARSPRTTLGGGPRCQEAIEDIIAQTRFENTKTAQALEITSLKMRVKKFEKKQWSRTHKLKRLYKVGLTARVDSFEDDQSLGEDASKQGRKINKIDADEDITLVNDQNDVKMFDVNDLHGEEVFFEKEVADKEVNNQVQKVVKEVVEETNTAKLIVNVAHVSAAGEVNAASVATIKEENETWAMKMEYWIMNTDHNLWKIVQNGNNKKSLGRDSKRGIIILHPVSFEEHVAVQKETKARTLSLEIDVKGGSSYSSKGTTVAPEVTLPPRKSVSHIVGLDLSKLAIILNRLKKFHSKGLASDIRAFREL
nr:ribonuclease H-like domain, reverse transcriptase, RNA-dependent DNA polymerase [Tanacetum cinerariifolium]